MKFWIGAGAHLSPPARNILALSGVIPPPPPIFGRRTKGHYDKLKHILEKRQVVHNFAVEECYKMGGQKGVFKN